MTDTTDTREILTECLGIRIALDTDGTEDDRARTFVDIDGYEIDDIPRTALARTVRKVDDLAAKAPGLVLEVIAISQPFRGPRGTTAARNVVYRTDTGWAA